MNEKEYLIEALKIYNLEIPKVMDLINDKLIELKKLEIERNMIINTLYNMNK